MYAIYAYIDPPNHPNIGIYIYWHTWSVWEKRQTFPCACLARYPQCPPKSAQLVIHFSWGSGSVLCSVNGSGSVLWTSPFHDLWRFKEGRRRCSFQRSETIGLEWLAAQTSPATHHFPATGFEYSNCSQQMSNV